MKVFEVKIPLLDELTQEATINQWFKHQDQYVDQGEILCEVETDKINFEILAEVSGRLRILVEEGETVKVGANIAQIILEKTIIYEK